MSSTLSPAPVRWRSASENGSRAQQCRAAGERLVYGIGEPELLVARQHEEAVPSQFVGQYLQVGQEFGDALDLVQDGAFAQTGKKAPWVGFGEFSLVGRFQIDVFEMREGGAAQGGLAGLPRPGHGDERVLLEQPDQAGGDFALDHGRTVARRQRYCKFYLQFTSRGMVAAGAPFTGATAQASIAHGLATLPDPMAVSVSRVQPVSCEGRPIAWRAGVEALGVNCPDRRRPYARLMVHSTLPTMCASWAWQV